MCDVYCGEAADSNWWYLIVKYGVRVQLLTLKALVWAWGSIHERAYDRYHVLSRLP